jgi:2-desacetyl-2-hydroxyethyl bacteriochlorophyllide A dehydrogenase
MTVKAAVLSRLPAARLEIAEVPEPAIPPGSVLVEMSACGICGTDLHIMGGSSYRPELPFVLGHEPVGTIIAASPDVDRTVIGRRVAAAIFTGCGRCPPCRSGDERLCERGARVTGVLGPWGGFADRLVLAADHLVGVPAALSNVAAASLVDAGATAHNTVRVIMAGGRPRSSSMVVAGAGPLGLLVAGLLRVEGIAATLVEPNSVRREAAGALGLTAVASIEETQELLDVVADCAGVPEAVAPLLGRLAARGLYVSVGYSTVPRLDLAVVSRRELTIRGIRSGSRADLARVLDLAADGTIRPPACQTWGLEGINDALGALRSGVVAGKAVIEFAAGRTATGEHR